MVASLPGIIFDNKPIAVILTFALTLLMQIIKNNVQWSVVICYNPEINQEMGINKKRVRIFIIGCVDLLNGKTEDIRWNMDLVKDKIGQIKVLKYAPVIFQHI